MPQTNHILIRRAAPTDMAAVTQIYNHYIINTTASYHETAVSEAEMLGKYEHITREYPYFVAIKNGELIGFAYADRFRPQSAWKLLECTIYLSPSATGKNVGKLLYEKLIAELKHHPQVAGLVAMISLDNEASIKFHESLGFALTGKWEHCGIKFGQWLGTGSWYLMF